MAAETVELATIWLVDLVGSTRLATAVGPVRADSLRNEYFALLRDAINASGGRELKKRVDAEHLPCYLESTNPVNLPRYQALGFRRIDEFAPAGGPTVTTMWREAR